MRIYILTVHSKQVELDVELTTTIAEVKLKLEAADSIYRQTLYFIWNDIDINDDSKTIADYNITEDSILFMGGT